MKKLPFLEVFFPWFFPRFSREQTSIFHEVPSTRAAHSTLRSLTDAQDRNELLLNGLKAEHAERCGCVQAIHKVVPPQ